MPRALTLPSTCLRCQLHAAVRRTGTIRNAPKHIAQRCKAFSTYRPRLQETDHLTTRDRYKGGTKWRSVALLDEKNDGRQKPIIVLDDIPKDKGKARGNSRPSSRPVVVRKIPQDDADRSPSAKQIESVVIEQHTVPTQGEVNASIKRMGLEATKKSTVLSPGQFKMLLQDLAKGYTAHQLNRYLDRSIRAPLKKVFEFPSATWRPGRTPLTQRHSKEIKKKGPSTKLRISERILRLAWQITVESEEIRDGELEIKLKPWQLSLLFQSTSNGTRYLEGLVTPQTLIKTSEIQAYRPDNVMRITGRCQTAEEIARQLQLALLKVHRLERDLKPLVASLGRPGATHETIFRSEDIDYVAQLTESVIVSEDDGVLAIYGLNRIGTQNAHRLLLALLDQPHGSFNEFASIADDLISSTVDLPVGSPTVGVHRRYHGLELLRTVRPRVLKTDQSDDATASASANIDNLATSLSQQLDRVVPLRLPSTIAEPSDSYWRGQGVASAWKAKFCTLLHPKDQDQMPASNAKASSRPQTIIQHAAPCPEHLLSHFQASKNSGSSPSSGKISSGKYNLSGEMLPYLKVHLKPFPQKPDSATVLPRLEMRFRFLASKVNAGSRKLILTGMQAVIDEQRLSVPLPGYATDLQFTRQSKLLANIDAVKVDPSILRFIKHLQQSARIDKGSLTAPAELSIKLPSWLGGSKEPDVSSASQDHATTYLFERFEQIQEIHFTPQKSGEQAQAMDVNVNSTLEALPGHIRLKYREVEGGAIYGNTTHLSLDFGRKQRIDEPSETEEESTHAMPPAISTLDLAGAALRIAELLTCSSAGTSKHNGETAKD